MDPRQELQDLRRLAELESKAAGKPSAPQARPVIGAPPAEQFNPTDDMGTLERLRAGIGSGMVRGARGGLRLSRMLTPAGLINQVAGNDVGLPEFASKESIRQQDAMDKPLEDTTAGGTGRFVGELAATAPLGLGGKAPAAVQGARTMFPRAAAWLAKASPRAAGEGAVSGAAYGSPDDTMGSATRGAGFGILGDKVGSALGRTIRGLVQKSPEAELMEMIGAQHGTDIKLPLSQAAGDEGISGILKSIYAKILPAMPGAGTKLAKQEGEAASKFREIAMKEGAPDSTKLMPNAGDDVHTTMKQISDAFDQEYASTIKSYVFNVPQPGAFAARIRQAFPNIDNTTLKNVSDAASDIVARYSNGGKVLDGDNLVRARTELARLGREAGDDRTGQAFYQTQQLLDDVVRTDLKQGGNKQNLADLAKWEALAEPWKKFTRIQQAAARTTSQGGRFTPKELKGAVKSQSTDAALSKGEAPLQDLAEVGEQTVGNISRTPTMYERAATWAALAAMSKLGPLAPVVAYGGSKLASSRKAQDALMGQTASQKYMADLLRKYPELAQAAESGVRNTLIAEGSNASQ